ncbi:hypothetical protein SDC9_158339 [bioreactor metagenome]|uniref:Uncharacterized protein n=1 Tax=bioreactor metagenome TaxID=1076179 RepID=A0A645F9I4_9ZZZZ
MFAVLEHHDRVGDLEHLAHPMGHQDERGARIAQLADQLEQRLDVAFSQARCRLVEDQDPGRGGHGLGDLHHLLFGQGQIAHHGLRGDA